MKDIFRTDSLLMRIFTQIANIAIVNILCLLCCLPVFTAGAAITAMYHVLFQHITGKDDTVVKPFFIAFIQNFKQSTTFWVPVLAVVTVLLFDAIYLIANYLKSFHVLWIPFIFMAVLFGVLISFVFPLIARFQCTLKDAMKNALLLFIQNLFPSFLILFLNILPWVVVLFLPAFFLQTSLFWLVFGGATVAYCNSQLLIRIFNKYAPADVTEAG